MAKHWLLLPVIARNIIGQIWLKVAKHVPGFPVEVGGENEPHAAFRKESRTRRYLQSRVQEVRGSPGPPFVREKSKKSQAPTVAQHITSTFASRIEKN